MSNPVFFTRIDAPNIFTGDANSGRAITSGDCNSIIGSSLAATTISSGFDRVFIGYRAERRISGNDVDAMGNPL